MKPAPNSLSLALLERRRLRYGQGYAFGPGEYFPMEVTPLLFGKGLRLYVPVLTDDLLSLELPAAQVLTELRALAKLVSEEEERAVAVAQRLGGGALSAVVLFQALGYEIARDYRIVHRSPQRTLRTFLEEDLRLGSQASKRKVAARFETHGFAESMGYRSARQDAQQAEVDAARSVVDSLLAIEREIALFIIGGEIIRGGVWLVQWAQDLRAVEAVVRTLLATAERHRAAAAAFALLDGLLAAVRAVGRRLLLLLTVVGTHEVLLEIVPLLARLESLLGCYLEAELETRLHGAAALDGWVVDEDPVDRRFVRYLMAQQPEGERHG